MKIDFETFVNGINDDKKFNDFKARLALIESKKNTATNKIDYPAIKIEEPISLPQKPQKESFNIVNPTKVKPAEADLNFKEKMSLLKENSEKGLLGSGSPIKVKINESDQNDLNELMLSLHPKTEED